MLEDLPHLDELRRLIYFYQRLGQIFSGAFLKPKLVSQKNPNKIVRLLGDRKLLGWQLCTIGRFSLATSGEIKLVLRMTGRQKDDDLSIGLSYSASSNQWLADTRVVSRRLRGTKAIEHALLALSPLGKRVLKNYLLDLDLPDGVEMEARLALKFATQLAIFVSLI